jgi:hypothetical protein
MSASGWGILISFKGRDQDYLSLVFWRLSGFLSPLLQRRKCLVRYVNCEVAFMGWRNLNPALATLITMCAHVRFGWEGEDGVFHQGHIPFGNGIDDITHEKVTLGVSVRQQRRTLRRQYTFRHFTHQILVFGVNHLEF